MNFNQGLELTQSQSLVMTTQLKQSLAILNMSKLELDEEIKRECEENPLIDAEKTTEIDWEAYIKNIEKSNLYDKNEVSYNRDNEVSFENMVKYSSSLYEDLHFHISLYKLSKKEMEVCDYIIDSLDEDGYLRANEEEIISELNIDKELFESCLLNIQQLEPNGVGARNISECLIIQIRNLGIDNEILEKIILNDLELIGNNKYRDISKKYKISLQQCVDMMEIVKSLNPKPGISVSKESSMYIHPDVIVEKLDGEFIVYKNTNDNYQLNINNFYKEILKNASSDNSAKSFIKEKLNSATMLIKSIESRNSTIMKIAKEIVKSQQEFFENGVRYIKPMRMKDIADRLGFHESTISRGVNGKYMLTTFGIFEFRYFFSSAIESNKDEGTSSLSIKKMIQDKIKAENKKKPLSDDKIASMLKEEGINIARRTIAKYREELKIPSSSKRKQY